MSSSLSKQVVTKDSDEKDHSPVRSVTPTELTMVDSRTCVIDQQISTDSQNHIPLKIYLSPPKKSLIITNQVQSQEMSVEIRGIDSAVSVVRALSDYCRTISVPSDAVIVCLIMDQTRIKMTTLQNLSKSTDWYQSFDSVIRIALSVNPIWHRYEAMNEKLTLSNREWNKCYDKCIELNQLAQQLRQDWVESEHNLRIQLETEIISCRNDNKHLSKKIEDLKSDLYITKRSKQRMSNKLDATILQLKTLDGRMITRKKRGNNGDYRSRRNNGRINANHLDNGLNSTTDNNSIIHGTNNVDYYKSENILMAETIEIMKREIHDLSEEINDQRTHEMGIINRLADCEEYCNQLENDNIMLQNQREECKLLTDRVQYLENQIVLLSYANNHQRSEHEHDHDHDNHRVPSIPSSDKRVRMVETTVTSDAPPIIGDLNDVPEYYPTKQMSESKKKHNNNNNNNNKSVENTKGNLIDDEEDESEEPQKFQQQPQGLIYLNINIMNDTIDNDSKQNDTINDDGNSSEEEKRPEEEEEDQEEVADSSSPPILLSLSSSSSPASPSPVSSSSGDNKKSLRMMIEHSKGMNTKAQEFVPSCSAARIIANKQHKRAQHCHIGGDYYYYYKHGTAPFGWYHPCQQWDDMDGQEMRVSSSSSLYGTQSTFQHDPELIDVFQTLSYQ